MVGGGAVFTTPYSLMAGLIVTLVFTIVALIGAICGFIVCSTLFRD